MPYSRRLTLPQQRSELTRYLGDATRDLALVRELRDRGAFQVLPPTEAGQHERILFANDIDLMIQSILENSRD